MTTSSQSQPLPHNIRELRHQVSIAIDRIIESDKAKILNWNGEKIIATSIDGKRAGPALARPTCLGVYDFDSSFDQILGDLLSVIQQNKE
ncbi:hypothetical protein [Chromobacterium haemolyticum]|uniref:hypothetical protein n=1 Tax=Chromobacterium haemolyticum TaxID=394935 RepID=UPI00244CB601|nr:hypothetical protein [Chromobacterium haemolyticum]MDH0342091.1 hypothetical protein [Chromobacterium haemolyticum]